MISSNCLGEAFGYSRHARYKLQGTKFPAPSVRTGHFELSSPPWITQVTSRSGQGERGREALRWKPTFHQQDKSPLCPPPNRPQRRSTAKKTRSVDLPHRLRAHWFIATNLPSIFYILFLFQSRCLWNWLKAFLSILKFSEFFVAVCQVSQGAIHFVSHFVNHLKQSLQADVSSTLR